MSMGQLKAALRTLKGKLGVDMRCVLLLLLLLLLLRLLLLRLLRLLLLRLLRFNRVTLCSFVGRLQDAIADDEKHAAAMEG